MVFGLDGLDCDWDWVGFVWWMRAWALGVMSYHVGGRKGCV